MRSLVLALMLLPSATSAGAPNAPRLIVPKPLPEVLSPSPSHCPSLAGQPMARSGESLKPRKLTELPPAKAFHAVVRRGPDGCLNPLFVGYQYQPQR